MPSSCPACTITTPAVQIVSLAAIGIFGSLAPFIMPVIVGAIIDHLGAGRLGCVCRHDRAWRRRYGLVETYHLSELDAQAISDSYWKRLLEKTTA